jgi:histidyl-tRNA synthetase
MKLVSPLTGAASGFPEYTPAQQRAFDWATTTIKGVYESFGFTPLETAAVEKLSTLESKGISAKEVYGIRRLNVAEGEDGGKDLALRFDLTVPTARYVVDNVGQLVFPFRRYQVQPVWRGERAQAGRYRQFYQFDIDTIGDGALPLAADAEIIAAGYSALRALGIDRFTIHLNSREFLVGMLDEYSFTDIPAAIKVLDDYEKVGEEITLEKLSGLTQPKLANDFMASIKAIIKTMNTRLLSQKSRDSVEKILALCDILEAMLGKEVVAQYIRFNPLIARGLDYYTGTVVETKLEDAPELGSIMSGGRYEDLAASLGKKKMPGVGISIGISRLMTYLLGLPDYQMAATPADVLVAVADEAALPQMAAVAQKLRAVGVKVELAFPGKGLGQQLQTAEKRGLKWAVTGIEGNSVKLREFASRKEQILSLADVATAIK